MALHHRWLTIIVCVLGSLTAGSALGRESNAGLPEAATTALAPPTEASVTTVSGPAKVELWTWIYNIHDIDFAKNEFTVDFDVSAFFDIRYKGHINLPSTLRVVNAKSVTITNQNEGAATNNTRWRQSFHVTAVVSWIWDLHAYPLTRERVLLQLEDDERMAEDLVFVTANDNGLEDIKLPNLRLTSPEWTITTHKWGWGESYSRYSIGMTLRTADAWAVFFKLFGTLFIATTVALLSLQIRPTDIDARFGLPVGALFASIANQYVVNAALPVDGGATLSDSVHRIAFLAVLACVALSVYSLRLMHAGKEEASQRADRIGVWLICGGYVLITLGTVALEVVRNAA